MRVRLGRCEACGRDCTVQAGIATLCQRCIQIAMVVAGGRAGMPSTLCRGSRLRARKMRPVSQRTEGRKEEQYAD